MRLFQQRTLGAWQEVFARMAGELEPLVARARQGLLAPLTPGELLDKLTILDIKRERITDSAKRVHVEAEWTALVAVRTWCIPQHPEVVVLTVALRGVNEDLWQIEEAIRLCERARNFGPQFIELARSIYRHNDERAHLKACLNCLLDAPFTEQKAYAEYLDTVAIS